MATATAPTTPAATADDLIRAGIDFNRNIPGRVPHFAWFTAGSAVRAAITRRINREMGSDWQTAAPPCMRFERFCAARAASL